MTSNDPRLTWGPHNTGRGSQADQCMSLTVILGNRVELQHINETVHLIPVTPNEPGLACDSRTWVEGLKLSNKYESYCVTMTNHIILM